MSEHNALKRYYSFAGKARRLSEIKWFAHHLPASRWQSGDYNPPSLWPGSLYHTSQPLTCFGVSDTEQAQSQPIWTLSLMQTFPPVRGSWESAWCRPGSLPHLTLSVPSGTILHSRGLGFLSHNRRTIAFPCLGEDYMSHCGCSSPSHHAHRGLEMTAVTTAGSPDRGSPSVCQAT